jgi:type I restriction enzyme R subunit
MSNEADTCREYVQPKLASAGWTTPPYTVTEQRTFTDGRIVVTGNAYRRKAKKRVDYLLRLAADFPTAVVEAKAEYKTAGAGLQQAKDYAQTLGLSFAYATNGHGIVEFDFITGAETELPDFPTPAELWVRLRAAAKLPAEVAKRLLTPFYHLPGKEPRYYQETAVNRAVAAVLGGRTRILLTMATGTGKTLVAFQVCWKLWSSGWNRTDEPRGPRILFLADRTVLVDDPHDKTFAPFADARHKVVGGKVVKSREMYFATYQAIAGDDSRPGLYKEFAPDFFDLIVVDECHRGSSRDDGNWREILEYFAPAYQLGMTATPLRLENRDTYDYFGFPVYTYSLREGIADGFLAPYRVHRIVTEYDAAGWRPSKGQLDKAGQLIPDQLYATPDFERTVSIAARNRAIALYITNFLRRTDRFAKTIVFCVDQDHADLMRTALNNLNTDLVKQHPDYVCRVTSDEKEIGRGHLSAFQDVETRTPTILTTSQLLTTGVDAPTCKVVVLVRMVGSMSEFKQIIGRGTRVKTDCGKAFFTILDFTGSATAKFADPDFDGDPIDVTVEDVDADGNVTAATVEPLSPTIDDTPAVDDDDDDDHGPARIDDPPRQPRRKYRIDGGHVEISADLVYELDGDGKQLRCVKYTDYTAERVRTLYPDAAAFHHAWADPAKRADVVERLAERGIDFDAVTHAAGQPAADPFDLLCHLAYNAPVRTRKDRADRMRTDRPAFFAKFGPDARAILDELLTKYADHGAAQFVIPDALKLPPISTHGNVSEIAALFGGVDQLRQAVTDLQSLLYAI